MSKVHNLQHVLVDGTGHADAHVHVCLCALAYYEQGTANWQMTCPILWMQDCSAVLSQMYSLRSNGLHWVHSTGCIQHPIGPCLNPVVACMAVRNAPLWMEWALLEWESGHVEQGRQLFAAGARVPRSYQHPPLYDAWARQEYQAGNYERALQLQQQYEKVLSAKGRRAAAVSSSQTYDNAASHAPAATTPIAAAEVPVPAARSTS